VFYYREKQAHLCVAHLEASLMTVEAKAIWMNDEGKKYSLTHHNQAIAQGRQDAAFLVIQASSLR
jgi:hypothetical protein